jgi:hypothetical protein
MDPPASPDPAPEVCATDPDIRRRILEYLGGSTPEEATCLYLSHCDSGNANLPARHPPARLDSLLNGGQGIARSLADLQSVLIHLDIEYVDFDDPAAAFVDPARAFALQQPVVEAIEELLLGWGIRPLHLVTGQGHHFVWRIDKRSPVAEEIGNLGIWTTPELVKPSEPVFPHLALVMEYFAHCIKREGAGLGRDGRREMISIDVSEYGDPLDARMIRIPYTRYRKPWVSGLIDRLGLHDRVPEIVTLPLYEMDICQLLEMRRDPEAIATLARRAGVAIPAEEAGSRALLNDYLNSPLKQFHQGFYTVEPHPPEEWPETYGCLSLESLPGCVRQILAFPNDLLLKPAGMQLVTRALLADGWEPRHIAGLIRSKFEDSVHDWGQLWSGYNPSLRAEFYVRLFAGEIVTGLDSGVDFNCTSQQEKGHCWPLPDGCSLGVHYHRLFPSIPPNSISS